MADHLSPQGRSRVMATIRSKDTKPELAVRRALRAVGATGYRLHCRSLAGRPDIAFTRWKIAVFVDGAFWHGHPRHFNPETATQYWRHKIERTQERDLIADQTLKAAGWVVVRCWDFEVKMDLLAVQGRILRALYQAGWNGQAAEPSPVHAMSSVKPEPEASLPTPQKTPAVQT